MTGANAMPEEKDVPGVLVFPPLIPPTVLVVGILLDWMLPLSFLAAIPLTLRVVAGLAALAFGLWALISARQKFKRIGTNVNPFQPSLAIAHDGIYSRVRNPMYVGGVVALLGIILIFRLEWTLLLLIAGSLVLHFGVVLREERYLERKFGDDYRRYKQSVPRYGWKF
jgi:protein-S-isoprenylcysteine O-methyltransferase Ste14